MDDRTFDESHRNEESPRIQQKVHGKMLCPLDGSWLQQPRKVHKDLGVCYQQTSFLIILEGEKGRGWEMLKSALSSMSVVPPLNAYKKGRHYNVERVTHNHVGPLYRSFANVVRDKGQRRGGLVLVGRWAQAVVCECSADSVKWVEVGRVVARSLRKKGVATIVQFLGQKGVFFVETMEEALFLQDLRFIKIEGGNSIQLRRWLPKENSEVERRLD